MWILTITITLSATSANAEESPDLFQDDSTLNLYHPRSRVCGVIATAVALQRNGVEAPLETIADKLPVTHRGSSMADIAQTIECFGLETLCVEVNPDTLHELMKSYPQCSAVARVDDDHWLYIEPDADRGIRYFEYPEWGALSRADLRHRFSGQAVVVAAEPIAPILRSQRFTIAALTITSVAGGAVVIALVVGSLLPNRERRAHDSVFSNRKDK